MLKVRHSPVGRNAIQTTVRFTVAGATAGDAGPAGPGVSITSPRPGDTVFVPIEGTTFDVEGSVSAPGAVRSVEVSDDRDNRDPVAALPNHRGDWATGWRAPLEFRTAGRRRITARCDGGSAPSTVATVDVNVAAGEGGDGPVATGGRGSNACCWSRPTACRPSRAATASAGR